LVISVVIVKGIEDSKEQRNLMIMQWEKLFFVLPHQNKYEIIKLS